MILAETARPSQMEITFDTPQWQETHLVLFSLHAAMCYWHFSRAFLRGIFFFNSQLVSVFSYLEQPSCLIFTEALCWFFCLPTVKRYKGTQQFMHLQLCSHNKVLKIKKLAQGNCLIWERLYRQWTSVSQLRLMALSAVSCARSPLPKKILEKE